MTMKKPIPVKISEGRRARGLTQEKLGAMLGVSPQAVSRWEKGECLPDLLLIPQLCQALGLSADALLEVAPPPVHHGTALVTAERVEVVTPGGLTLTLAGAGAVQAALAADPACLRGLLADEEGLCILREMAFRAPCFEQELAGRCGLPVETTEAALLRLLKQEICQCTPDGYVLGANAYLVLAALAAAHLATSAGRGEVRSITTSYST